MFRSIHEMQDEVEKTREYFIEWYEAGEVEEKVKESAEFVSNYLEDAIVSVSGGKDSMVLLHVIYNRVSKDITIFHWDNGILMPRDVEQEVLHNIRSVAPDARMIIKKWNPEKYYYREFFGFLSKLGAKHHILGIRAEEARRRKARGRVCVRKNWIEVHPLFYFTWRDVWAYVFKHSVPVPSVYLRYAKLIGWDKVRFATFHDQELERFGNLVLDSFLMWRSKSHR
ncbi:MAG: phosphoadenosine phosphosulfate reductase family protein [Archaeoglobaceae archaeon]